MDSEEDKCDIIVAVAGNPNVGKSTLFNVLTGETAHVANWPGTTVERKEGVREHSGRKICFVDLPGTYGISASSLEEVIAREYIMSGEPDLVMVLVDSTVPERSLYLPVQILELTPRVVVVLTKIDMAHSYGVHIHVDKLEEKLGVPVVPVSAIKNIGIKELLDTLILVAEGKKGRKKPLKINYGIVESFIGEIERLVEKSKISKNINPRWIALRLLEGDSRLEEKIRSAGEFKILEKVREVKMAVEKSIGGSIESFIITARFNHVDSIAREVVVRKTQAPRIALRLEKMLEHHVLGPITSMILVLAAFSIVFAVNTGFPLNIFLRELGLVGVAEAVESYSISGLLGLLFDYLSDYFRSYMTAAGAPYWTVSLVADGIIPGVGSILGFFPLILLAFVMLALMEDSGIAPRIAVSLNSLFNKFSLTGRAVFPVMISLGCNVPAVMVTRAFPEEEERIQTALSVPFIPCQARLIVLLAFITTYFASPIIQSIALLSIYGLAIVLFALTSLLIRRMLFKLRKPPELLLELPPIHTPSMKVVWWITWDYSKHFLRKAGLIIFSLSVATWMLMNTGPAGLMVGVEDSYASIIGGTLAPILELFGFRGDVAWIIGFSLINGFVAKEAMLESIVLLTGSGSVEQALAKLGLSGSQVIALMVLVTTYIPCLATTAVIYQETGSVKKTILQTVYMLLLAMLSSIATYLILQSIGF